MRDNFQTNSKIQIVNLKCLYLVSCNLFLHEMYIAGLQKTTLVDFPGLVAATVFTRGCSFRCGFCHNPELVIPEKFIPAYGEEEIYKFLDKRVGKLKGVCITGGEPLLQNDISDFISHIKAMGFKVKLDTNGSFPDKLERIIGEGDVSYYAMDIKSPFHKYEKVTSLKLKVQSEKPKLKVENLLTDNIKRSIKMLMNSGIDYEFRTTVAKPYHEPDDFLHIGEMISGAKKYYIQNFVKSKHIDEHENFESFSADELDLSLKNIQPFVDFAAIR